MFKVLFITRENDWFHRLAQVFPDLDLQVERSDSPAKALKQQQESPAEVIVFDIEFARTSGDPLREVKHVAGGSKIILLASSDFKPSPEELSNIGIQVLTKPITVGEIGLALSRAKRAS